MTASPITKDPAALRAAKEEAATRIKAGEDAKIATLSTSGRQADDEDEEGGGDTDEGEEVEANDGESGLTKREKARRRAAQWAKEEKAKRVEAAK